MTTPPAPAGSRRSARRLVVVLVGIDGAGKTTVAHALRKRLGPSVPTLVLANYSGRRTMTAWLERSGLIVPVRVLDVAESVVRFANVVANHLRARRFDGVVLMDRHLHCQQALRTARGLHPGRFLAAMAALLPAPDAVVFLDVTPEEAHRRITERGTDAESLEDLRAYRNGYLALPGFARFHRVAADAPLPAVLDDLEGILGRLGRGSGEGPPHGGASGRTRAPWRNRRQHRPTASADRADTR